MSGAEEDISVASDSTSGDENFVTAEQPQPENGEAHLSGDEAREPEEDADEIPEINFNSELTDDVVRRFRHRVVDQLKEVYRGDGSSELVHAVDRIVTIYSLAYQHKKGVHFVQLLLVDLERRLSFLIDNNNYLVGRLRALSVMARFAAELAKKDARQNEVIQCLVDFVKKNEYNASAASRSLICYLSGVILTLCVGEPERREVSMSDLNIEEETDDEEFPLFISLEAYMKLYSVIESRTNDKSAMVRKEALRAISNLQDGDIWGEYNEHVDPHPSQVCINHVNDEDADVRVVAIKTLLISDEQRVRDIVARAVQDPELSVQKEAFVRICQDLHIGAFSRSERMALLETICHHDEVTMRETAVKLITTWATQICRDIQKELAGPNKGIEKKMPMEMYARTPLYILKYLDILANPQLCQTVMLHLFYIASLRYPDISTTPAYVLLIKDENGSLNRQNYESIMNYKLPLVEVAHRLFFWRTFVLFGQRAAKDAAEWLDVTHQLLPTLRIFCEFVTKFVAFISKKFEGDSKEAYKMFAISELLRIPKLMEKEVVGTAAWRNLLTNLLTSSVIPTDKNLIDQCVADLFAFHYPNPEDVSSGIAEVCDATTVLINREASPDGTQMNGTISLANHGNPTYQPGHEEMEVAPVLQAHGQTLTHCLMIVDAMMRTGRITNLDDPFVSGICENIVEKGAISTKAEDRRYAFRCYAVMSMHNMNFAKSKIPTFKLALQVEVPDNKAVVVTGISDIVMRWTYRIISDAFGFFEVNRKTAELAEVFANLIADKNLQRTAVPEKVINCVTKWMMLEVSQHFVPPLAQILLYWARTDDVAEKAKRVLFIDQFLREFTQKSRTRKVLLAESLFVAFDIIKTADLDGAIAGIDPEDLVDKVIELTDEEMPKEEKRGSKQSTPVNDSIPSVHIELIGLTIVHLNRNSNDPNVMPYARILSMVNLEGLKGEMAIDCDWIDQLKEIIDEISEDQVAATKLLKSFLRGLESRLRSSVSTRRRGSARKPPARTRSALSSRTQSTTSDDGTSTSGSVQTSKASTPLTCRELLNSLPAIQEENSVLHETTAPTEPPVVTVIPPEEPEVTEIREEKLTNGTATRSKASKIPVPSRVTRQRASTNSSEEEKGGRSPAIADEALADITTGVVRLHLNTDQERRRPLRETSSVINRNDGKNLLSKKNLSSTTGEASIKKVQQYRIPDDDDDEEFVTRRRRPVRAAPTRQNPSRATRKPVTYSCDDENED